MLFDYVQTKAFAKTLEVDDLGNFAIKCSGICIINKFQTIDVDYYLSVQTIRGQSYILKFGPILPAELSLTNEDALTVVFNADYKVVPYKEAVITREINLFINDQKKQITEIEIIEAAEMLKKLPTADKFIPK